MPVAEYLAACARLHIWVTLMRNCQWYCICISVQEEKKYMAEKQEADQAEIAGHMIQHYLLWFVWFRQTKKNRCLRIYPQNLCFVLIDSPVLETSFASNPSVA